MPKAVDTSGFTDKQRLAYAIVLWEQSQPFHALAVLQEIHNSASLLSHKYQAVRRNILKACDREDLTAAQKALAEGRTYDAQIILKRIHNPARPEIFEAFGATYRSAFGHGYGDLSVAAAISDSDAVKNGRRAFRYRLAKGDFRNCVQACMENMQLLSKQAQRARLKIKERIIAALDC